MEPPTKDELLRLVNSLIAITNAYPGRSREVSLAITKLQEAKHWIVDIEEMD